ncbi:MAG: DUF4340 domain-containing protein [Bdellovibrionia bacterium]
MSQVSWNRQLGLAISLFALSTFAYWLEFKHKPEKEASEERSKRLFTLKEDPVHGISISSGALNLSLSCVDLKSKLCKPGDQSKWEITSPLKTKADDGNVNSLLSTLHHLTPTDVIDLKDEGNEKKQLLLKDYGLDPASLPTAKKISVTTEKGMKVLYLGQAHPLGESLFAAEELAPAGTSSQGKPDTDRIFLINHSFKTQLERDLSYWRNKKLFSLGASEIESFELKGPQNQLQAFRKDGRWTLKAQGKEVPGDIEAIDTLLTSTVFLSAKGFVSDQKAAPPAQKALIGFTPAFSLKLQTFSHEGTSTPPPPLELKVFQKKSPGSASGKLLATLSNSDPLFELDPSALDRLNRSVKDLRWSKLISSMDQFSAKRLEFEGKSLGSKPWVWVNQQGKWILESTKAPVASEKVQATLDLLSGNRIEDTRPSQGSLPQTAESLTLTLGDDRTPKKRQFLFWKKDGKLWARDLHSNMNFDLLIQSSVEAGLPWNDHFFTPPSAPEPKTPADLKKP